MGWQILAGIAGALVYYVTRYQKSNADTIGTPRHYRFGAYLKYEWLAFTKGCIGFFLLWALWVYGADVVLELAAKFISAFDGLTMPAMNVPIALVLGGFGKPFYDRIPRLFEYITGKAV
jgi:hypothetical protein